MLETLSRAIHMQFKYADYKTKTRTMNGDEPERSAQSATWTAHDIVKFNTVTIFEIRLFHAHTPPL